jgi:CubicO group peptidase (beta-lactamase class C family)
MSNSAHAPRRQSLPPLVPFMTLAIVIASSPRAQQSEMPTAAMPGTVVAAEARAIRDNLAPLIIAAQERYRVPGLSLVLVRRDGVLWAEGFGHADRERGVPAGPETVYRAGSLAKPLTATAVMQLAEAGHIDIDQPLNAYLPDFSIRSRFDTIAAPITVRAVLSHHAGLPTDLNKGMWTDMPYTRVATALAEEFTAFPPDFVFAYSNIGYTLLGHMVEEVSGVPYADYMAQRLFGPLGMRHSGLGEPGAGGAPLAQGYRDGEPFAMLPIRDLPAHGLYTSATDLGRYLRALLNGGALHADRVLDKASVEQMCEAQNLDVPLDLDIVNGLGWFLEDGAIPGGGTVMRHGGTTLVFAAEMILLPERGLGVVVLANADGSRALVSRLAEAVLSHALERVAHPPSTELFLAELDKGAAEAEPGDIAGRYATDFGLISIRAQDPKLCACIVDETFDLIPYPNGWFGLGDNALGSLPRGLKPLAAMRFRTEAIGGREVVVARNGEERIIIGEKVPDTPVPQVWLDRVGHYELLNPDPDFPLVEPRLKLRDGHLCMSYRLPKLSSARIEVPLRPISDTEAIILGLGRTRGETLRVVDSGGEERLRYSGFIGRKIAAEAP